MDMEKLVALCRRKGFIFQSSEIYGGINGFWDYGPLGVELKKTSRRLVARLVATAAGAGWARDCDGVDCSLIMNPQVWVASGHAAGVPDQMVACNSCKKGLGQTKFRCISAPLHREGCGAGSE